MGSKHFNALISPDAYEYLDEQPEDELLHDRYLQEQEDAGDIDDSDASEDECGDTVSEETDDSDMYSCNSLFETRISDEEAEISETPVCERIRTVRSDCNDVIALIISKLPAESAMALYLEKLPLSMQDRLAAVIVKACTSWKNDRHDKMFEVPNAGMSVAVVSSTQNSSVCRRRLESIGARMVACGKSRWTVLFLIPDENGEIESAETTGISQALFSESEWKTVCGLAEKQRR